MSFKFIVFSSYLVMISFLMVSFASDVLTWREIEEISNKGKDSNAKKGTSAKSSKKKKTKAKEDQVKRGSSAPKRASSNENKSLKKELEETKEKLNSYRYVMGRISNAPQVLDEFFIPETALVKGTTNKRVVASNIPDRVTFENLQGLDLPEGSKIVCEVYVKNLRVCGVCFRLIIDGRGQDINATLKNKDGSKCAIGEISNHEERYLTGILLAKTAESALKLGQKTTSTFFGSEVNRSAKNALLEAAKSTASTGSDLMKQKYETHEPIVVLKEGTRVLIEFNEAVDI